MAKTPTECLDHAEMLLGEIGELTATGAIGQAAAAQAWIMLAKARHHDNEANERAAGYELC